MGNNKNLRSIEIARLAFIGSSITTLGDGISAVAAGLALDALEQDYKTNNNRLDSSTESRIRQLDYFINELVQIKKSLNE